MIPGKDDGKVSVERAQIKGMADFMVLPHSHPFIMRSKEVIEQSISFAKANDIPLNSLEGFVRQIIGWREFIRGIYESRGSDERTRNFWGFNRIILRGFIETCTRLVGGDHP